MRGKNKRVGVILEGYCNPPDHHEISVAFILCSFFQSNVRFVPVGDTRAPDMIIERTGQYWEIKHIRGNGKNTIRHALLSAKGQAENVVISLLDSKMDAKRAIGRIKSEIKTISGIKRVILVTKTGKVVVVFGKVW